MSEIKFEKRLSRKLIILVILFSSAITFLTTGLQLYREYEHDLDSIQDEFRQIGVTSIPSITEAIWNVDTKQLEISLNGILALKGVEFAEVSYKGNILASSGTRTISNIIRKNYDIVFNQLGRNIKIGILVVHADKDAIYARLLDRVGVVLLSNGIKTFLVAFFISILFGVLVTRHLATMTAYARRLELGGGAESLKLDRAVSSPSKQDELDGLVSAINEMQEKLRQSHLALQKSHDELEDRVSERTEELSKSQQRLQSILDSANQGVLVHQNYRPLYANQALADMYGYASPDEILALSSTIELQLPNHITGYDDHLKGSDVPLDREYKGVKKDGTELWVRRRAFMIDWDGEPALCSMRVDISDSKEAEDQIRDQNEQLGLMFSSMAEGIITITEGGEIETVNPMTEEMFGYAAEELIGKNVKILMPDPYHNEHDSYLSNYHETGEEKIIGIGREVLGKRKDGTTFPMDLTVNKFTSTDKIKYIGTLHDLTARKESEQDLITARLEAESANQAKTTFLASASHDVRQPLQALGMFLSVLEDKLFATSVGKDETIQTLVGRMNDSVTALDGLFSSLLEISKLDAGTLTPNLSDFGLDALMSRLFGQFEAQAKAKGLNFSMEAAEYRVRCDEALLSQILSNFLGNAIRYTENGKISFAARQSGGRINIEVTDTGIGIPSDKVGNIFDEFYQVGNQHRDRTKGLGLGLAIAKRTADLLGLPLTVASEEGRGTTFAISILPLEGQELLAEPEPMSTVQKDMDSKTVLLIDDDPSVLESLKLRLESWEYNTLAANSFEEAQGLLRKNNVTPKIIISDLRLAGHMDGIQVIKTLQGESEHQIPGIILTGDTSPDRLKFIKEAGLSILHKPVKTERLAEVLKNTFN
ncbi:MAG: PAS domain S-box protein [Rhodospirillales bacterium]|jgi:PAS domain S-box-containing protein|nr:PAS domain S-box protein [Rhodospirillaceae bacterium]MBT7488428.1 PAS domain S-box protein [Rhodospirillales bacterium]MBT5033179.1 PAS domain S-box protein [Rhodospirillaceae bacterium]MBT6219050.1 PAS domain S-box protein [Rhodospirillaceae bacterium]MBT6362048.1 PAS domain S-box protein [Rhodospirillaceae bacterium]